jgi:DNA-nicking Smr family endonuclease
MARRGDDDMSSDDRRLWLRVTGTVAPRRLRKALLVPASATIEPRPIPAAGPRGRATMDTAEPTPPVASGHTPRPQAAPDALEPRRQRRLARERDPIEARFDLHGYGRFEAEDRLKAFLISSQARGCRAVLVITGQGRRGGGVIRASIQEWLHAPALRGVVSGFAPAHRRHGGDGAVYVTLKRL